MRRAGGLGRVGRRDGSRVRVARREARVLRAALVAVLWLSLFNTTPATADGVEMLMVPSAAMGRDIPVAFQGGGTHAAVLLDAFNAGPETSNWIGAGAFNTLAGKGISAVAPAGGAWSLYTNWEQDSGKQWETFLADELPNWLAANKGLAPGGHGIVGAAQGGTAALTVGGVPSRPLPLCRHTLRSFNPVPHRSQRSDHRGAGPVRRSERRPDVGPGANGPLEMARPRSARRPVSRQPHPALGVQPSNDTVR